jgi:hypothetical protein
VTVIECNPSSTYNLTASALGFCAGDAGVTFSLSGTEIGRSYELYKGDGIVATLTGTENAAAFNGFQTEGIYTAKVLASGGDCEATMSGTPITISRNSLPTQPTIAKPSDVCFNGGSIVFMATGYTGSLEWVSTGGGSESGNSVTFASGAETGTKIVKARSAQTHTNAPTCYSAGVTQSAAVNAIPAMPTLTVQTPTGLASATFTASYGSGTYDWDGYFSGDGVVKYTPAEAGTYTARVRSSVDYGSLTCYGDYSASASALVQNKLSLGAACTTYADCASNNCQCQVCADPGASCANGYFYMNITGPCPAGYTTHNTFTSNPVGVQWTNQIRRQDCNGSPCTVPCLGWYMTNFVRADGSRSYTQTNVSIPCPSALMDVLYVLCYKKL